VDDIDAKLSSRVRDIIAVVADDIDAVRYEIEDGVVYIEGVVTTDEQRDVIARTVGQLEGVEQVVNCLSTERLMPPRHDAVVETVPYLAPIARHYPSTS
jgi:osmotically-inducible protein OsmY